MKISFSIPIHLLNDLMAWKKVEKKEEVNPFVCINNEVWISLFGSDCDACFFFPSFIIIKRLLWPLLFLFFFFSNLCIIIYLKYLLFSIVRCIIRTRTFEQFKFYCLSLVFDLRSIKKKTLNSFARHYEYEPELEWAWEKATPFFWSFQLKYFFSSLLMKHSHLRKQTEIGEKNDKYYCWSGHQCALVSSGSASYVD